MLKIKVDASLKKWENVIHKHIYPVKKFLPFLQKVKTKAFQRKHSVKEKIQRRLKSNRNCIYQNVKTKKNLKL